MEANHVTFIVFSLNYIVLPFTVQEKIHKQKQYYRACQKKKKEKKQQFSLEANMRLAVI